MINLEDLIRQVLLEEKKKRDRCLRIADRKFEKPSAYKSGAVVRCRQGKIWKDLKEIGDSSSQPYSFDYYGESDWGRIYGFDTENYPYTVEIIPNDENPNEVSIRFYVPDKANPDIEDDVVVTNEGNLFKVMATVSNIIKKDIQNHPEVDTLIFAPSKKPGEINNISRLNLYLKYIKKENPNAIITKGPRPQDVKIILKETDNPQSGKATPYGSGYTRLKKMIQEIIQEDESLRKWFKRQGPSGKEGGWVDCNTCRKVDGKTKCKACGRKKGEKRAKYPSCRPTPSQCKQPGKGKKWGKTK